MKILSLEINCFRGIKKLNLTFNGDNALIYGDNGTGKSGVIDAIDFLLKGDITRLSGSGTKNLSINKHGKYVTENIEESWVEAKVKLSNHSESICIQRFLAKPNDLICEEKYKATFVEIQALANLQIHYLSRREILQFVNTTEQDRAKSIEKLLNLVSLEKNRAILQRVNKLLEDALKANQQRYDTYKNAISTELSCPYESWLDEINNIRFQLGAKDINILDANSITQEITLTRTSLPLNKISALILNFKSIANYLSLDNVDSIIPLLGEALLLHEQIQASKTYENDVKSIMLYEQGVLLATSSTCPLCGQDLIDKNAFLKRINEKIEKLEQSKQLSADFKKCLNKIDTILFSLENQLVSVDIKILQQYADPQCFIDTKTSIEDLKSHMSISSFSHSLTKSFISKSYGDIIKLNYIDILSEKSVKMSSNTNEQLYKSLVDIGAQVKLYLQSEKELNNSEGAFRRAAILFKNYISSQTLILNEVYNSIQDRFSQLYRSIHGTDEGNFSSVFNRKAASLELQVRFKDGNMYPPNAVHSEGHQDSMGICLFFALSEKISNSKLDLILLDDVVMSIDIDHRKNFCRVIKESFPDKQFIITTHDYIWRRELSSLDVVKPPNVINFKAWDLQHGPYVEVGNNIWFDIDAHLEKGEKNEAIGLMRYYMEEFFQNICAQYKLKVPYSITKQWSLEDVLPPANNYYKKAFAKAKESRSSFGKDTTRIDDLLQNFKNAYSLLCIDRWTINPATHFNEWAQNFSIVELNGVCQNIISYCNSYKCPKCHSLIKINADLNGEPQNIACNCSDLCFSCVKKL